MNKPLLILCAAAATLLLLQSKQDAAADEQQEDLIDSTQTVLDEAMGTILGAGPIADMVTSPEMQDMLKRRERLSLTPYNLGDGGWTIGYGHFARLRSSLPDRISRDEAEAMFITDLAERGEKWVKLYITVPLTQYQFDALVSIAFNMSPQSFKKFAASVNAGQGINDIAQQSVAWVSSKFTNGIQNRRDAELQVFNNGVYA